MARCFAEAHVARNERLKHLIGEVTAHFGFDLPAEVVALIDHGENDAHQGELRVEPVAHEVDGFEQTRETLERVVLALQGHDDVVRGRERIQREQPERRRTVDQDDLVGITQIGERVLESPLAVWLGDELDLGPIEIPARGNEVQVAEFRREHDVLHDTLADQCVIDVLRAGVAPERARRIGLGVDIDQEGRSFQGRDGRGDVDSGGGLANAPLLVDDGDHAASKRHWVGSSRGGVEGGADSRCPGGTPICSREIPESAGNRHRRIWQSCGQNGAGKRADRVALDSRRISRLWTQNASKSGGLGGAPASGCVAPARALGACRSAVPGSGLGRWVRSPGRP